MASTVTDGTIRIDTKIDEKGFKKGIANMSASFKKLKDAISTPAQIAFGFTKGLAKSIVPGIKQLAENLLGLLKNILFGGLVLFGASLVKLLATVRDSIASLINTNLKGSQLSKDIDVIKGKFTELKFSVAAAFLPLIQAAIPYIKIALDWLIQLFNRAAMITAAFMGQKEVLQVVAGSAAQLAANTDKARKAAQGALAAFDQINVLQQADTGTDLMDVPMVETQMIPITDEILKKVQEIKDTILSWWDDPIGMLQKNWGNIVGWFKSNIIDPLLLWLIELSNGSPFLKRFKETFIDPLAAGFFYFVSNTLKAFKDLWKIITDDSMTIPEKIKAIWGVLVDWFRVVILDVIAMRFGLLGLSIIEKFQEIKEAIISKFTEARENALGAWENLVWWFRSNVLDPLRAAFSGAWDGVRENATNAKNTLINLWSSIVTWFRTNVTEPLRGIFDNALSTIGENFGDIFMGIKNVVRGVINDIIDIINGMVGRIFDGINAVIDAANSVGNILPGYQFIGNVSAPHIPHLATGAVIPPNAAFAAILGDQKSGRNIEAPEALIRQIIREEIGNIGEQKITVEFTGSMAQFVRELHPLIKQESTRIGGSLIKSGVTTS